MITAIFGASLTGKTTVARHLAVLTGQPLRSCGEEVWRRAEALHLSVDTFPDDDHRDVDSSTIAWAQTHNAAIVEGRFLDAVLSELGHNRLLLVHLICRIDRRMLRLPPAPSTEPSLRDGQDAAFRARLGYDRRLLPPNIVIDTSDVSATTCAEQIRDMMNSHRPPLA